MLWDKLTGRLVVIDLEDMCYEIQGKVSTWEVDEAYIDYTHGSLLIERSNEAINDRT
ncbi:hypothetical protein BJX99DRAFT_242859 [Aspergillus californicus]